MHSRDFPGFALIAGLAFVSTLAGCNRPAQLEYRLSGPTMGTQFTVSIVTSRDFDRDHWQRQVFAALDDLDANLSTYRDDSALAKFNRNPSTEWQTVPGMLCAAVERSLLISDLTDGAFDVTVGTLVNLWGFGPHGSRTGVPDRSAIDAARAVSGRGHLQVDCALPAMRKDLAELQVDLSAFAKGLAADTIARYLADGGFENYLVEIGGDLRAQGHNGDGQVWRIAIEEPDSDGRVVGIVVPLADSAIATSGDYRNYFETEGRRYSHTIDPRTGRPVTHALASASVTATTAALADALATALMVLGPDEGLAFAEREGIAAYFLLRENDGFRVQSSSAFRSLAQR